MPLQQCTNYLVNFLHLCSGTSHQCLLCGNNAEVLLQISWDFFCWWLLHNLIGECCCLLSRGIPWQKMPDVVVHNLFWWVTHCFFYFCYILMGTACWLPGWYVNRVYFSQFVTVYLLQLSKSQFCVPVKHSFYFDMFSTRLSSEIVRLSTFTTNTRTFSIPRTHTELALEWAFPIFQSYSLHLHFSTCTTTRRECYF